MVFYLPQTIQTFSFLYLSASPSSQADFRP
jgi:hypothetical protein